jgi:hypothetical protein
MGKIKDMAIHNSDEQMVIGITEIKIRSNPELYKKLATNNNISDFEPDDVVKCTFLKGLFKVAGPALYDEGRLSLYPIDYMGEFTNISPDFLKKVKVSDKVMKVLYDY